MPRTLQGIFAVSMLVNVATPALAQELKCEIRQKYACEAADCKSIPASVWSLIDIGKATYTRCDTRGCDTYGARFSVSGDFINIDVPGRGMVAKVSADHTSFLEVATMGLSVLTSFGLCRRN